MAGEQLLAAIRELLAVDPETLGERALAEEVGSLLQARGLLDAALAQRVASAVGRQVVKDTGTAVDAWLQTLSPVVLSREEGWRVFRRSQLITSLPGVSALHAGGEVSSAFLDAAGRGLRKLPAEAGESWDALPTKEAGQVAPEDVSRLVEHVRALIDADDATAAAEAKRSVFNISPFGSEGAYAVNGTLYGLDAERFHNLVHDLARPQGADDVRPACERRASAVFGLGRIADLGVNGGTVNAPHGPMPTWLCW